MQWLTKDDWFCKRFSELKCADFLGLCALVPHQGAALDLRGGYSPLDLLIFSLTWENEKILMSNIRKVFRPFANPIWNTKTVLWQSAWKNPCLKSLRYLALKIWNIVSQDVRSVNSLSKFISKVIFVIPDGFPCVLCYTYIGLVCINEASFITINASEVTS